MPRGTPHTSPGRLNAREAAAIARQIDRRPQYRARRLYLAQGVYIVTVLESATSNQVDCIKSQAEWANWQKGNPPQ